MRSKKNRKFISEHFKDKTYLVFYCDDNSNLIRESEGPFTNEEKAYVAMSDYLLKGICSWMVVYNE